MVNIFLFSLRDEAKKKKKRAIQEAKFEKNSVLSNFFAKKKIYNEFFS